MTNALGHVTTYDSYDAAGRLTQMTDPNGLRTNFTYDARGRVTTITQTPSDGGAARVTAYTYDAAGNVTSITFPDGVTLTYTYDAAQMLRQVTDNLGNRITYDYDLRGNRTEELTFDPDGTLVRTLQTGYDIRNHVATLNSGGSITQQLHDALGNLIRETDPNQTTAGSGLATQHQYDALNRLIQTINTLSGVTTYDYDVADRLTRVRAPNDATTQYRYDDLGNLLQEISPDRGITTYTYDAAGNLVSHTDSRGITVSYTYDALNRLTRIDYPNDPDVAFTYDASANCTNGVGRLCQVIDESGTVTYGYDAFGNLLEQRKTELGITYTTRYTYDAQSRITSVTYPDGRLVTVGRDAVGRIAAVSAIVNGANTNIVGNRSYRADGRLRSQTFGNGFVETRTYDLQGRITAQSFPRAGTQAPPPVSGVVLAPDVPSPQTFGTTITFNAQASGGTGSYEYRFTLSGPATGDAPIVVQDYSPASTFVWNTTQADLGSTTVTVHARNAGAPGSGEASASTVFVINDQPAPVVLDFGTVGGQQGSEFRFTVEVPPGAANLVVTLRGGTGDADLYLKYEAPPTTSNFDCASIYGGLDGRTESCVVIATPGTWHILVAAYTAIADVEVQATYTMGDGNLLANGVSVVDHTATAGSQWLYAIDVPANAANLTVTLSGGSGDADLYVKYASPPSSASYDCRSIYGLPDGQTETCVVTAIEGRWYVLVSAYTNINGVVLTASYTSSDAALLQNATPVAGLAGSAGSEFRYMIDVPAGAANLNVTVNSASGDPDLYVKRGSPPTPGDNDCRSIYGLPDGQSETCVVSATEGRWYILVRAYTSVANLTLTASYTTGDANLLQNGVPVTGLTGGQNSEFRYAIDVPVGASNLVFTATAGIGDADLYVRHGAPPGSGSYDCYSLYGTPGGPSETCAVSATPGRWYILLRAASPIQNFSLTASYTQSGAHLAPPNIGPAFDSQLVIVETPDDRIRYWLKSPATRNQWLAVNDARPYLHEKPDLVAKVGPGGIELWQSDESQPLGYHYLGGRDDLGDFTFVALSSPPNPADTETWSYTYDANGNLLGIETQDVVDLYGYDALDRLTLDQYGSLPPGQYGYDANGNRTSRSFDGFSENYTYAPDSNRLVQKGGETFTYDSAGNLIADGQQTYIYNDAGQLRQIIRNGSPVATYTYNHLGQRTRKVTEQGTTVYHYDQTGNLIGETSSTGQFRRDYVYADNIPIAQIDAAGPIEDTTYLHTDHLGTSRVGTDVNRTVVWRWRSLAFGGMAPNEDPDGDGVETTINLRFAGQYADAESGLIYNWNNFYDSKTGRWLTPDRRRVADHVKLWEAGLRKGGQLPLELNPYLYVAANPLRWTDPRGLEAAGAPETPKPPGGPDTGESGGYDPNDPGCEAKCFDNEFGKCLLGAGVACGIGCSIFTATGPGALICGVGCSCNGAYACYELSEMYCKGACNKYK